MTALRSDLTAQIAAETAARSSAISAAKAEAPVVKIKTQSVGADTSQVDVSLSGLSAYSGILVDLYLTASTNCQVLLNGLTSGYSGSASGNTALVAFSAYNSSAVLRLQLWQRGSYLMGLATERYGSTDYKTSGCRAPSGVSLSSLTKLSLIPATTDGVIKNGTKIVVYGLK